MKPRLARLTPHLVERTRAARETYAAEKLELDTIRLAMDEAAGRGEEALRVPLDCDVRETAAAAALTAWAAREELVLTWEMRPADRPDGRKEYIFDPEIRWMPSRIR